MKEIHELMDQLATAIQKAFPIATNASVTVHTDGYRSIVVEKMEREDGLPVEAWKRRELMDQYRISENDKWSDDRSADQNEYYRTLDILWEEG